MNIVWFPVTAFLMKGQECAVAVFASETSADEYAVMHPEYERLDYHLINLDFMFFKRGQ